MTYPQIGNYGINAQDVESRRPWVEGFIVKENCPEPSNWRSEKSLHDYLAGRKNSRYRGDRHPGAYDHFKRQGLDERGYQFC